jgi:hypothetical protein
MTRGPARFLLLAAGPLALLGLAASASPATAYPAAAAGRAAASRPTALAGFATVGSGSANQNYNSAGSKIAKTKNSTGNFTVTFFKLGGILGGHAEVTSMSNNGTCSVEDWAPLGPDLRVHVLCYDLAGTPADTPFSLMVTQPLKIARGLIAFDSIRNDIKSQTLTGKYQYNSTGRRNSVRHLGTGRYQVTMPGAGKNTGTGTVKVSAFGAGAGDCQLSGWSGVKGSIVSHVDCYSPAGARQNRPFDIEFVRNNNLLGVDTLVAASAFATRPAAELYQPSIQYDSRTHARVSVSALVRGEYVVLFVNSNGRPGNVNGGGGNVQFTPVSGTYVHCAAAEWLDGTTPFTDARCITNKGKPVFTKFDVQWAANR